MSARNLRSPLSRKEAPAKRLLIVHAGQLLTLAGPDAPRAGRSQGELGLLKDGALLIEGETIAGVGPTDELGRLPEARGARELDAGGKVVLPGFVDSHSHPVFVQPRLEDFGRRIRGSSYLQIAQQGGGILSTVAGVRSASEDELAAGLRRWVPRFLECGTTTLEAKSGYGLSLEAELKILRAIRRVGEEGPLELVPTFLGAHAVPPEFEKASRYAQHVAAEILPAVARERLAEFADVFCDQGHFSPEDAETVLVAAEGLGLRPKLHAEQLGRTGGVETAAKLRAVTADHLDHATPQGIRRLKAAGAIAGLVPGSNYFLGKPYPPARALVSSGVPVALATDFNPGSCPCWNMQLVLSIACTQLRLTPEEALVAATINGAHAVGRARRLGSLETGKQADVVLTDAADYRELAYWAGGNQVRSTLKRGRLAAGRGLGETAAAPPAQRRPRSSAEGAAAPPAQRRPRSSAEGAAAPPAQRRPRSSAEGAA